MSKLTIEQRAEIVQEAMSWIHTPYHHAADVKGVGVDCAMILIRIYSKLGHIPMDVDPRPYPQHWYLHHDEERYLGWIWKYAEKVDVPLPGDIALYRFGRTISHGGIIMDDKTLLHADAHAKKVELCWLATMANRFEGYWSIK